MLVLDLGFLGIQSGRKLNSNPEIEAKQRLNFNRLGFLSAQQFILMCKVSEDWLDSNSKGIGNNLIPEFSLNCSLSKCFEQIDHTPFFHLTAQLPNLSIACSDQQLKLLLRIISSFTKRLE
eukprot:Pgem_evm1s6221